MDNIFLSFTVNILLFVFAIYPLKDIIYEKSDKKYIWQKITKSGWRLIFLAFLIIGFNFLKDLKAEKKQNVSEKAKHTADSLLQSSQIKILQLQISSKDSIIKEVKSTYTNSIKASNEALAKYNLKFTDSLHSVIDKLKLKAITSQLLVAPLSKGKKSIYITNVEGQNELNIKFISKGGTSYHILLTCYFIRKTNLGYTILGSDKITYGAGFIVEHVESTRSINIAPDMLLNTDVLVLLTGSFTKDPEGNIIIPFDYVFRFNFKKNKLINVYDVDYQRLKNVLKIK